jgi:hypothetical protein
MVEPEPFPYRQSTAQDRGQRSGLAAPERNIDARPASLLNHYPAGTLSVQRRTGGRDRRVTQQLGCHLDRHTAAQQLGRPGVPKSMRPEH